MATTDGLLSSDDELFVSQDDLEPDPFTFQSDLSDDDDDDGPDPLALDEIATQSLATLQVLGSLPDEKTDTQPTSADEDMNETSDTNGDAETPADEPKDKPRVNKPKDKPRSGTASVGIEVRLPWLKPTRRAEYQHIEVEDYQPPEEDHGLRRKRRVSGTCVIWVSLFRLRHAALGLDCGVGLELNILSGLGSSIPENFGQRVVELKAIPHVLQALGVDSLGRKGAIWLSDVHGPRGAARLCESRDSIISESRQNLKSQKSEMAERFFQAEQYLPACLASWPAPVGFAFLLFCLFKTVFPRLPTVCFLFRLKIRNLVLKIPIYTDPSQNFVSLPSTPFFLHLNFHTSPIQNLDYRP